MSWLMQHVRVWHGRAGMGMWVPCLKPPICPMCVVDDARIVNASYLFQVLVCSLDTRMLSISWFDINFLGKQLRNGVCHTKQLVDCPRASIQLSLNDTSVSWYPPTQRAWGVCGHSALSALFANNQLQTTCQQPTPNNSKQCAPSIGVLAWNIGFELEYFGVRFRDKFHRLDLLFCFFLGSLRSTLNNHRLTFSNLRDNHHGCSLYIPVYYFYDLTRHLCDLPSQVFSHGYTFWFCLFYGAFDLH